MLPCEILARKTLEGGSNNFAELSLLNKLVGMPLRVDYGALYDLL